MKHLKWAAIAVIAAVVAAGAVLLAGRPARPRLAPANAAPVRRPVPVPSSPGQTAVPDPAPSPTTTTTAVTPAPGLATLLDALLVNTSSCLVVSDGTSGAWLYAHQPGVAFAPASSQKLLIAAAALDGLGPGYRFTTTVVAARQPVGGEVDDVWLVGSGDPLLASPEYAAYLETRPQTAGYPTTPLGALADQLAAAGVHTVRNGVHGDDSRYETLRYLPPWGPRINHGEFDIGPLGAVEVDQGLDSWRPAIRTADPTAHGAGVLARLLMQRGVAAVQASDGRAPAGGVTLASIQSAPLDQIVGAMLRASDNQIAELLVRELDRQGGGNGTTAGGVRRVMALVSHLGVPTAGWLLVDGSGLSPTNRVTCPTLLAALNLGDRTRFHALRAGLPVAGVSGTLYNLFRGTPVAGRLSAKGGYITGVTALVGRLDVAHPLRFALIANGDFSYPVGIGLDERVVTALAGWSPAA